jgi:hypothetical protein
LKRWRYVGVYARGLMLCAAIVRVGLAGQRFWAVWDSEAGRLRERTRFLRPGVVRIDPGRLLVRDRDVDMDLVLDEGAPIEVVSPHGAQYAWTRKHGGGRARGAVRLAGRKLRVDAGVLVDESAGYHAPATAWAWSAGVGVAADGRRLAWNLVEGVHDAAHASERTVWVDGVPHEPGPVRFFPNLETVRGPDGEALRFAQQAERRRDDNLLLFRSRYRQPFGSFAGVLPGGIALAEGYGVMERHDARW